MGQGEIVADNNKKDWIGLKEVGYKGVRKWIGKYKGISREEKGRF